MEHQALAVGVEAAAEVLDNHGEARTGSEGARDTLAPIGRPHHDRGPRPRTGREVDVGGEESAVAHGHLHGGLPARLRVAFLAIGGLIEGDEAEAHRYGRDRGDEAELPSHEFPTLGAPVRVGPGCLYTCGRYGARR